MGFDLTGLGSVADLAKSIIDLFPSEEKRAEVEVKLQEFANQVALAQIATNTAEAATGNLFLAGWRPFIGWICGLGFAYSIILTPFGAPALDNTTLNNVLWALLGIGSMRTVDKVAGVATGAIKKIFK